MKKTLQLHRRSVIKGLGVSIALPFLEAMAPGVMAANNRPKRALFIYLPNGIIINQFVPNGDTLDNLPSSSSALNSIKNDVTLFSGFRNSVADGGNGGHSRGAACFLSNVQTNGNENNPAVGTSADQLIAQHLNDINSLALSVENAGCDQGCVFNRHISWSRSDVPKPRIDDPIRLYDRLVGLQTNSGSAAILERNKSVLDFALEESRRLNMQLGSQDRSVLDEWLTSLRETERKIIANNDNSQNTCPVGTKPASTNGVDRIPLMFDMLAIAMRCNYTQVASYMLGSEIGSLNYKIVGVDEDHHSLSHHGNDRNKIARLATIDKWRVEQFVQFISKLKAMQEGEFTVLDNSLIQLSAGIDDPNIHAHSALPAVVAGSASGDFNPRHNRHVRMNGAPVANLHLAFMRYMGRTDSKHGNSNGVVTFT